MSHATHALEGIFQEQLPRLQLLHYLRLMLRSFCAMLVFWLFATMAPHPYYLSVTDLRYNPSEKRMQGSVKVFINDLEKVLSKYAGKKTDLHNDRERNRSAATLSQYIHDNLKLSVNRTNLQYKVLGSEAEDENLWIYLESDMCGLPKVIDVTNTILYDLTTEQINIVQVEVNEKKLSLRQSPPEKHFHFGPLSGK
jgi:hypothetical protein